MQPVVVTEQLVIEGGHLKKEWVPVTASMNGSRWLELSKSDRNLMSFAGRGHYETAPFACNSFFDAIRDARNEAVDNDIFVVEKSKAPATEDRKKGAIVAVLRRTIDIAELPATVVVQMPAVTNDDGDTICGAIDMRCITTLTKIRNVSVEATTPNLQYVLHGLRHAKKTNMKRDPQLVTSESAKGVLADKRRKTLYMIVKDEVSKKPKRVQAKPEEWEQPFINQCAEALARRVAAGNLDDESD